MNVRRSIAGRVALLLGVSLAAGGCARDVIPNTDVEDTSENREILRFTERYRTAVETRNVGGLLAIASSRYYDDNGTPVGDDDIDFDGLRAKLARWQDRVLDVRYEMRYRRVSFERERIYVDYTYTGSFRLALPEGGDRWSRRLADNRLVLTRENGELRVLSGM